MSLNVLVVDDSAVARTMIVKILGISGLPLGEVFQAANGLEGLACLQNHWVDLAITDLNMPEMNGEEMIGKLRADPAWAALPIIVVSTEGSVTRIERLQQAGVKFVHKPFTPESVRQIVLELTGVAAPAAQGASNDDQSF